MKYRLKDLAAMANVSIATVTRVLKNKGYVSQESREAVEQVLRITDYMPNRVAQGLKSQRTGIIGHILPTAYPNPFFAGISLGVDYEAVDHGFHVLSLYSYGDAERESKLIADMASRMVDGIVVTRACSEENVSKLLDRKLPVVMIERQFDIPGIDTVLVDTYRGAYHATNRFISAGHVSIGFIGQQLINHPLHQVEKDRYQGYSNALKDAGLVEDKRHIQFTPNYDHPEGYQAMKKLLSAEDRPTAIFIASDMLAIGGLQYLYEQDIRVPRDISIIGYDNTYSEILSPPISTVALPMKEMGSTAVQMLMDHLNNENAFNKTVTLQTNYVDRGSVRTIHP